MPRPSSGQISLSQVRTDLAASGEINMDDSDVRALTFKPLVYPTGSMIKMSDLYYNAPQYTVTPSATSITEGSILTFTVTAPYVIDGTTLYWTNAGTCNGGDFSNTSGFNSGSLTITGGTGTFSLNIANDFIVEPAETIIIQIRTVSTGGTVVATADTVTVGSTAMLFNIVPDTIIVSEGGTVIYDITTTNVPDNFVLYWTTSGTVSASDFTDNTTSGSVVIDVPGYPSSVTGFATITRTLANDVTTEGNENMVIELRETSISDPIVAQADPVSIQDTSTSVATATYQIVSDVTSVNEGGTVTYTVSTQNVTPGITLYWNNAGTTTAADFTDGIDQGTVVLGGTLASGTATFTRTLLNDTTTEGAQTIDMRLRINGFSGSAGTQLVATATPPVTVNDTSTGAPASPTYQITGTPDPVNEGSTVTFNISTTNVTNGTVLNWENIGNSVAADFDNGAASMSGTVTINSDSGQILIPVKADTTTDGVGENIRIVLKVGTTVVATSNIVEINDTSQALPTYAIAPTLTTITEGQQVTFNVTTTGVIDGTVLSWTRNSTASTATNGDFSTASSPPALRGTVTINSNAASFNVTPILDANAEGTETLVLDLRTGGYTGTIQADTSANPVSILNSTYSLSADTTTIAEGQIVTLNVTTSNVPTGTNLYWTVGAGSTITLGSPGGDIIPQAGQGTVTVNSSGTASFQITAVSDGVVESLETMIIELRIRGYTGPVVDTETISIASGTYIVCNSTTGGVPGGIGIGGGQLISGYYNYNGTQYGEILGSDQIEGVRIIALYHHETNPPPLGGGGTSDYIVLALEGDQRQFDWISLTVGGVTVNRTDAQDVIGTYDVAGNWTRWYWEPVTVGAICGTVTMTVQSSPIANFVVGSAGSSVPSVYSEIRLVTDGRTLSIKQSDTAGTAESPAWYSPTTTGIGSSYQVKWVWDNWVESSAKTHFTMSSITENTWSTMTTFKSFRNTRNSFGETEGSFKLYIRPVSGGSEVYYAHVTLISNFTA